ncbi:hypothetical protein V8G54_015465 [Vigna mungo]|uniref:Uncharacterized protein n=1 Tax=Vigna mungo TaxID=3915 RepID=A0AAQ3NII7_VIGMU
MNGSPLKGFKRTSPSNSHDNMSDKVSPGVERNLRFGHNQTTSSPLYSWKAAVNPVIRSTPSYPKEFANDLPNVSSRSVRSHKDDRSWNVGSTDDPMDVSHGLVEKKLNTEENINGGPRWRSDEASDEEYDVNLGRAMDMAYYATPLNRTTRRSRVVRR